MSIYEGLSTPSQENIDYATTPLDEHMGMKNVVLNTKTGGFAGLRNRFWEFIAPINPFHLNQNSHRQGYKTFGTKTGNKWELDKPYPFRQVLSVGVPVHFDPTTEADPEVLEKDYYPNPATNKILSFSPSKVPYVCELRKKELDVCKMFNEGKGKACDSEADTFLQECPNFALRIYRENKIFNEKVKMIQRNEYAQAMALGSYNKGRSLANVSKKSTYSMGMAANLRPDSMWVDDRYVNVTQEDVDKAKAKLREKNGEFDFTDIKGLHAHPVNEVHYRHKPRMY